MQTNHGTRPLRARGFKHNTELENLIERDPAPGGVALRGKARTGEASGAGRDSAGKARHGRASRGKASTGTEGQASQGQDGGGETRLGVAGGAPGGSDGEGSARQASQGEAGGGEARTGMAGMAGPGQGGQGSAQHGPARQAWKGNGSEIATAAPPAEKIVISEPNFRRAEIKIRGIAPYVQHAFSQKARLKMEETQRAGSRSRTRKTREARLFEDDYKNAMHLSEDGWNGIPASGFRNALISACRVAGFVMTRAKLAVFVLADGRDALDGTPLVRIYGTPEVHQSYARNESGVADLRWRPLWREWSTTLRLEWDADMLSAQDIVNLVMRAGLQVGVGEGRPDSPNSNGLGWGRWEVEHDNS